MRFHLGFSFRLKHLKKFLFPILVGVLAYFGFGFFGFLNVFAYSNYNTSYEFTIEEQTYLNNQQYDDFTKKEFMDYFKDYDSQYYNVVITFEPTFIYINMIPKSINSLTFDMYGYDGVDRSTIGLWPSSSNFTFYQLGVNRRLYNFIGSDEYTAIKNCLDNNSCWSSSSIVNNIRYNKFTTLPNNLISTIFTTTTKYNINNNNSYNLTYSTLIKYFYSSQIPINLGYTLSSPSDYYFKKAIINDIEIDGQLPTYYDLFYSDDDSGGFIGYNESLKTFYTSLNPNSSSSYSLKTKFKVPQSYLGYYQTPQEYIDNTTFDYICGGRVNHFNYYTYESFNCFLSSSYTNTDNTIEYTFNNFTTTQSLTNYDKLYITIKSNYLDSNVSTTIFDFSYKYSLGAFYNTDYKGAIYEDFSNLTLDFKAYFSSNNSLANSLLYVNSTYFNDYNIKVIGFSNTTQQQNLVIGSSILGSVNSLNDSFNSSGFISTNVSNSIDTGIMIYQINGSDNLPSLDLFFNGGVVIDFNNTSTNDFYYIDESGNISNNNFINPQIDTSDDYNLSYYISSINNFLDSKRDSILQFSLLTQTFYNNLPFSFQTFFYIVFNFFCLLFVFLLIKRK